MGFSNLDQCFTMILFDELHRIICLMKLKQSSKVLIHKKICIIFVIVVIINTIVEVSAWWIPQNVVNNSEPLLCFLILILSIYIFYFGYKIIESLKNRKRFRVEVQLERNDNLVSKVVVIAQFFKSAFDFCNIILKGAFHMNSNYHSCTRKNNTVTDTMKCSVHDVNMLKKIHYLSLTELPWVNFFEILSINLLMIYKNLCTSKL